MTTYRTPTDSSALRTSQPCVRRGAHGACIGIVLALVSSLVFPGGSAFTHESAATHEAKAMSVTTAPTYTIRDDATGGDCTLIGSWDGGTRVCSFDRDLTGSIVIASNNVTLDGTGHTLTGSDAGFGVHLPSVSGVTIRNLTVSRFERGVQFENGSAYNTVENVVASHNTSIGVDVGATNCPHNTLRNVEAFQNGWLGLGAGVGSNYLHVVGCNSHNNGSNGIQVGYSSAGWVVENSAFHHNGGSGSGSGIVIDMCQNGVIRECDLYSNSYAGIHMGGWGQSNNVIVGNQIWANGIGIDLNVYDTYNTFTENVVLDNTTGVRFGSSSANNLFYRNDFDNQVNVLVDAGGNDPTFWDHGLPAGGNYWGDFNTPAQGCNDGNGDGFCDAPYVLPVGQDNYPRTAPVGHALEMAVDIKPSGLNLNSRGRCVTAFLCPPPPYLASQIEVGSIRLNDVVPVSSEDPAEIENETLKVKFLRAEVIPMLASGDSVPVTVTGTVAGRRFTGSDCIKVMASKIHTPVAGEVLTAGTATDVTWDIGDDAPPQLIALLLSLDDGLSWTVEAEGLPNTGSYAWTVPHAATDQARLEIMLIYGADQTGVIPEAEIAVSDPFWITVPTGVGDGKATVALWPSNPVTGSFIVRFSLASAAVATLVVYDVGGRQVFSREVGSSGPGWHTMRLGDLPAGVYVVRLSQAGRSLTSRVAVIR